MEKKLKVKTVRVRYPVDAILELFCIHEKGKEPKFFVKSKNVSFQVEHGEKVYIDHI